MTSEAVDFDPLEMLGVLERHDVAYILIGGFAATVHGSPLRTGDADICPERSRPNLERLCRALTDLEARIRSADDPEGVGFSLDPSILEEINMLNLVTTHGWLDIAFQPSGTNGFDDLKRNAHRFDLGDGLTVRVASLGDVIRSKEASAREKDRNALPTLRRLLERKTRS